MNRFFKTMMAGVLVMGAAATAWAGDDGNTFNYVSVNPALGTTMPNGDPGEMDGLINVAFPADVIQLVTDKDGYESWQGLSANEDAVITVTKEGDASYSATIDWSEWGGAGHWALYNPNNWNTVGIPDDQPYVFVRFVPQDNGTYTLNFPKGMLKSTVGGNSESARFSLTYTWAGQEKTYFDFTASPASGATVKGGDKIKLTAPFDLNNPTVDYVDIYENGELNWDVSASLDVDLFDASVLYVTVPDNLAAGTYEFVYPEGYVASWTNPSEVNAEWRATYTIEAAAAGEGFSLTAEPVSGSTVHVGDYVTLTPPDGTTFAFSFDTVYVTADNGAGTTVEIAIDASQNDILKFQIPGLAAGQWTFQLAAGAVADKNGNSNDVWTANYYVEEALPTTLEIVSIYPAEASDLTDFNYDTIKMTLNQVASINGQRATWTTPEGTQDGLKILFVDGDTGTVAYVSVTPSTAAGDYTLTIPAGAFITPNNVQNAEQTFSWTVVEGGDEDLKIVSVDPASGDLSGFAEGATLTITFNKAVTFTQGGDVNFRVYNANNDEDDNNFGSYCTTTDNIVWTWTSPVDHNFTDGETYVLEVEIFDYTNPAFPTTFENVATWTGTGAAAYEYSTVKLTNVNPDPKNYVIEKQDLVNSDYFTFTMSFDGAVKVLSATPGGQGGATGGATVVAANDECTAWDIKVKKTSLEDMPSATLQLNIKVQDAEGRAVVDAAEGVLGDSANGIAYVRAEKREANSIYDIAYESFLSAPAILVAPEAGSIEELYEFTVTTDNGYQIVWDGNEAYQVVLRTKASREVVATVTDFVNASDNSSVTMTLDKKITDTGSYVLDIPAYVFSMGQDVTSQGTVYYNSPVQVGYSILNAEIATDFVPESIDPADNAEVESLKVFYVTFNDELEIIDYDLGRRLPNAYVTDAYGASVDGFIDYPEDFSDTKSIVITLDQEITAAGAYTLTIPAAVVGNSVWMESIIDGEHVGGSVNPQLTYTYTVVEKQEPENPTEQDPDVQACDDLSEIVISWDNFIKVEIADFNGQLIPVASGEANGRRAAAEAIELTAEVVEDAEIPTVVVKPVTEVPDGEYELSIAAGSFILTAEDGEEVESEPISQTFNVTTFVSALMGDETAADVYTMMGVCVLRNATAADIANLENGLYIVNGKKIIVRK